MSAPSVPGAWPGTCVSRLARVMSTAPPSAASKPSGPINATPLSRACATSCSAGRVQAQPRETLAEVPGTERDHGGVAAARNRPQPKRLRTQDPWPRSYAASTPGSPSPVQPVLILWGPGVPDLRLARGGGCSQGRAAPTVRRVINAAHLLLFSQDADADRAFLRNVIGWPFVSAGGEGDPWLIFRLPTAEVAVHPTEGLPSTSCTSCART